jgi:hydroxyacylglutathione hydrolase
MKIETIFFKNSLRNFCYLISFNDGTSFCIDPFNSDEVFEKLGERKLTAIINTHDHCDHFSGNEKLVVKYKCNVLAHKEAVIPFKTKGVDDHELIHSFEGWTLEAIYTPGHTLTHLCLLLKKENKEHALFTGDCFFNAGVGNCHNGGDPKILYQTIRDIFTPFSDDLLIYPGHEYLKRNLEFTMNIEKENLKAQEFLNRLAEFNLDEVFFVNNMQVEREINTFLRLSNNHIKFHLNLLNKGDESVFLALRSLRNKW